MLDYEWENPSAIVISGDERNPDSSDSDPARALSIFDPSPYNDQQRHLISPPFFSSFSNNNNPHHHHHLSAAFPHTTTTNQLFHLYDPRTTPSYPSDPIFHPHSSPPPPFFPFDPTPNLSASPSSYNFLVPKTEVDFPSNRIGLNLGGRTYFSAADDDFVTRLYRRSRPGEFGIGNSLSTPRCQAEGCNADLSHAKHYHRRHKVCEFHSKASTVVAAGLSQRFCQQCSRFHLLSEFDNGKRSCRKRLADHNRRRRKSHHSVSTTRDSESPNVQVVKSASPSITPPPPTISLECFRQRQQFQTKALSSTSASSSSNSVFFSSG